MMRSYLKLVDNVVGLVAQTGRAPGFYSARVAPLLGADTYALPGIRGYGLKSRWLLNEKIPDGRGFKSLRARLPGR